MKTIHHVVDIDAPPEAAWAALTEEERLAGWWSTKVSAPEAEVGAVVDWTFLEGFNPDMEIVGLEPGRMLEWKCVGGHEPWADNTFRFELEPSERGTRLRFWQHYAVELADDEYGIYNYNWGYYLESLRLLLTEGEGKPYRA